MSAEVELLERIADLLGRIDVKLEGTSELALLISDRLASLENHVERLDDSCTDIQQDLKTLLSEAQTIQGDVSSIEIKID